MQLRTQENVKKLLKIWNGRETEPIRFTEIKAATGWESSMTNRVLKAALEEGYLEKLTLKRATYYRFRLADYRGYFDALQFLARIDSACRRSGKVLSVEHPVYSFIHTHVLAYGVPPEKNMTSIEKEMLFTIFARLTKAFYDYANFCHTVQKRQRLEQTQVLPDSVKSNLFAQDDDLQKPLSIAAAHSIYGDILWEHIFDKIVWNIRFALEKASLDFTGPIELLNCTDQFTNLAMRLAKDIYAGKLSAYEDPDPEAMEKLGALEEFENPFEEGPRDIAVVLMPSPQSMDEFASQVGKIVEDQYNTWNNPEFMAEDIKQRGDTIWSDVYQFNEFQKTRKELLSESIADMLATMRKSLDKPFSEPDKKLMYRDSHLKSVFTRNEIQEIIASVEDVLRRFKKFHSMILEGSRLEDMQNDPEWFSKEEIQKFHLAQRVYDAADWKDTFGSLGPVTMEFPARSEEIEKVAKGYQKTVRKELRKGRRRRNTKKTTNTSAG